MEAKHNIIAMFQILIIAMFQIPILMKMANPTGFGMGDAQPSFVTSRVVMLNPSMLVHNISLAMFTKQLTKEMIAQVVHTKTEYTVR